MINTICTLALVLLMDVSGSVTNTHYELQREGLIAAFEDVRLQQVILSQPHGVAIQLQQFGTFAEVAIPWIHLRTRAHIQQFVQAISLMQRADPGGSTGISEALRSGIQAFDDTPCEAEQQVIDIHADGENNVGLPPETLRDLAQERLITINALAIVSVTDPDLDTYMRERVITPEGFVMVAAGMRDFGSAITRKLALEIAGVSP
jgi:hypothetical protein